MIRVLQCVNNMHRAGLETVLMNYYRHIDRSEIQFDFLVHRPEKSDYDEEIEAMGGRIHHAPRLYPQNYPAYFAFMKSLFATHPEYRIVHSHIDAMSFLPLLAAKQAGVPVRIAHSHSTSIDRDLKYPLKQVFRLFLPTAATHCLACGEAAGEFLFRHGDFQIIPNAIETDTFRFSEEIRKSKRGELGVEDRFVIGHVGRFSYPKNHLFLIDIFAQLIKRQPDALLMLVGTGEKEQEVRQRVRELQLADRVCFLGSRTDLAELYQAMDAFVLPSLFEGVPVVGIEAQCADLPCFFSQKVPHEVRFSSQCRFLDLSQSAGEWAEEIAAARGMKRGSVVSGQNPFDITVAQEKLAELYRQLAGQSR